MVALELADTRGAPFTNSVQSELVSKGYIVAQRPGLNVLRIDPALTIDHADIEGFLTELRGLLMG